MLVTVGASEGIDLSLRVLMNPGDEVLIPEPSYVSYAPGVVFAGGVPVPVPTSEQNGFALMPEALAAAVTSRTKAVILPYPNNPPARCWTARCWSACATCLWKTT